MCSTKVRNVFAVIGAIFVYMSFGVKFTAGNLTFPLNKNNFWSTIFKMLQNASVDHFAQLEPKTVKASKCFS